MPEPVDDKFRLEHLKYRYGLEFEMIRAVSAFEHAALRPLFILNGGALITYLALLGTSARNTGGQGALRWEVGQWAVFIWVAGLIAATICAYLGARSQFAFRKLRGREADKAEIECGLQKSSHYDIDQDIQSISLEGQRWRHEAIAAGLLSLVLFIVGFAFAFQSFTQ